ncbi:MAG: protein-glutamate O-methyltransferase CheR [Thermoanaerobaculia bacterium]|nr:protein-glutamate O-methyltransferase CheR [Thermoanaerobaculia bacterium]
MTDSEFRALRDFVYQHVGILMTEQKRELLTARLVRRVRTLGLDRFGAYLDVVERHRSERDEMIDRIVTNETKFFREPSQFDYLEKAIIPRWRADADARHRNRHVRVWSAGCSMGQEPYSIAMILLSELPGWTVEVVATDISNRVLRQASEAVWPIDKATEIPRQHLEKYMLRGVRTQEGTMRAGEALRAVVRFKRLNLHETPPPDLGSFDLIFCRNVLIYFDGKSRRVAVDRLLSHLRDDGHFFLGHSESLLNSGHPLRPVSPSVYTWKGRLHA